LSRDEVERRFAAYSDRLWVAACNGPATTAVSGDPLLLQEIVNALQADNQFARLANAGVPAHSPKVDPLRAELFESIRAIRPRQNPVRMYSTVTAAAIAGAQLGPSYWVRNLREPVLFAQAVDLALKDGCDTFVELSPHPVLANGIEQSLARFGVAGLVAPSGRRHEDERRVMLETAARLFASGRERVLDEPRPLSEPAGVSVPVVLSAYTAAALRDRAGSIADFVRQNPDVDLYDIAYTTARRRAHHEHRSAVVAATRDELVDRLEAFARGEERAHTTSGRAGDSAPRVAFVFCGQGPQWWGMGRELSHTEPVFREVLERCDGLIRRHAGWSLMEELGRDDATSRVDRLDLVQPVIFSIQVASRARDARPRSISRPTPRAPLSNRTGAASGSRPSTAPDRPRFRASPGRSPTCSGTSRSAEGSAASCGWISPRIARRWIRCSTSWSPP
jgi:acyl transferase domain-containing protein